MLARCHRHWGVCLSMLKKSIAKGIPPSVEGSSMISMFDFLMRLTPCHVFSVIASFFRVLQVDVWSPDIGNVPHVNISQGSKGPVYIEQNRSVNWSDIIYHKIRSKWSLLVSGVGNGLPKQTFRKSLLWGAFPCNDVTNRLAIIVQCIVGESNQLMNFQ